MNFIYKTSTAKARVMSMACLVIVLLLFSCSPKTLNPELCYSTYLGGEGKEGSKGEEGTNNWLKHFSIDDAGSVYFATSIYNDNFPLTPDAYNKSYSGGDSIWGEEDMAIVEFNIKKNELIYSSYFGGKEGPEFLSQVLRKGNSLYLAGNTGSSDFPTTHEAYDKTFNGPEFRHSDAWISCFEGNKLSYSSYIGTSGTDWAQNIFVNDNNEITLVGLFKNFNELPNLHSFVEFDEKRQGYAGVIRLNAAGDSILSSTIIAPTWYLESCMDDDGNIYLATQTPGRSAPTTPDAYDTSFNGGNDNWGGDILVTKLNSTADRIIFSTFIGGSNDERTPLICLDKENNVLVYGYTNSIDFPITENALDKSFDGKAEPFLSKISSDGKELLFSSFIGGTEERGEMNASMVVSKRGDIYLCGVTDAADYPITENAIQDTINGSVDISLTVIDRELTGYRFSSFLGGSAGENARIQIDKKGDIIGVGFTGSTDFFTTEGAYQSSLKGKTDAIIFKISF